MTREIGSNNIADKINDKTTREIFALGGPRPNLAIIMVGENSASKSYIKTLEKEAKKVGIDTHLYKCDKGIEEKEVLGVIKCLNADDLIDGIIIQLPLPPKFNTGKLIQNIDVGKDASCNISDEAIPVTMAHIFRNTLKLYLARN